MKPTNKEIAGWLRESAAAHRKVAESYRKAGWLFHAESAATECDKFIKRAALVESMPDLEAINKELVEALEAVYDMGITPARLIAKAALARAKEVNYEKS